MDYSIKTKEELVAELEDLKKNYNALLTTLIPAGDDQHLVRSDLSESSQRWKYAIENTTDGLWDWDLSTNRVFFSKQWKAMLGFDESEIEDSLDEWSKRVLPEDLPSTMEKVKKHLTGETDVYSSEHRLRCKDGSVKWILDEGKIVSFDKDGKPARFIGTHKDITLRKKIEFDLKERMKELNCLNSISEIMSNPQLSIDDACQSIVQIIPASWQFPDFAQASITIQDKTYNTGKFKDCPNCMVREITTNEDVWGKITVCYPEENLPFHHQLFLPEESTLLYSIAERLGNFISKAQIQKHLEESELKYRSLIERINDVIYEIDDKGIIKYISPSIEKIVGFTQREIIGQSFVKFVGVNADFLMKRLNELSIDHEINNEYKLYDKFGGERWIRLSTKAIFDKDKFIGGTGTLIEITENKTIEQALKNSESLYRSILAASPDVITITDLNGKILLSSPFAVKMFGLENPESSIGHSLLDYLAPEYHEKATEAMRQMMLGNMGKSEEYVAIRQDRTKFDIEVNGEYIRNERGEPVNMIFVTRDISERKKTEQQLKKSEDRYVRLVESINDIIFEITLDGTITYVSPSVEKAIHMKPENMIGLNFIQFVHPEDKPILFDLFKDGNFENDKNFEYRYISDSGETIWVEASARYTYDGDRIVGRTGILHDITERKKAEEKLRKSEESFRNMIESINDVVYEISADGFVTYVSPSIERFLGYSPDELIGQNFFKYMHEDDRPVIMERLATLVKRDYSFLEYRYYSKSGEIRWVRSSTNPIIENGKMTGGRGVLIDITERKKAEELLRESEQRFRMVFENVFDGISIFEEDPDPAKRKLVDCNERYAAMAGRSREELLKIGTTYSFSQNLDEGATEARMKGISEKQAYHGSFKWIRPDGKDNIIEYIAQPINLGGKTYSIGIDRDITEFKQKEDQLRKLSQAVEQSPVSIVITDLDGNIEYANPKASATTGYSLEELKGQNPRVLKSGETSHNEYQDLWDSITHGNIWKGTFHNKRKNGELYWESSQITPITDSKGQIINFLALKEDITERKKMEEELTRSEERFRQITEQSQTVIWEIDAKGMYTYVSPIAQTVWGYEPHELIGQKYFYDLHPYEGRNEFKREVLASFAQKEIFRDITNQVLTKTNQLIWVSTNAVPILDNQNNLLGYRGADNDITARKQAEGALKRSEELLNYAQEIAHMGNWDLDLTTNEMTWSKNYYRLLGLDPEQDVPRDHFMKMVHPEDVHLLDEKLEEMIQTKGQVSLDMRLILSDGTIKWVQNNVVPRFSYNIMVGMSGVNIDITEKKLFEEKISYQHDRLNAIISAIPDMIFINDADGNYLEFFVSDNEKLLLDPNKIVGTNIRDIFDQKMSSSFLSKINKVLTKRVHEVVEYTVSLPNSQNASFEARIVPLSSDRVLILSRDITEKTAKDIQIKRLSLAIEQSPVSIVITDLDANIEYVNPSFETTTGYSAEEVIGKNTNILKSGQTDPKIYTELWDTIEKGHSWSGEWLNKKKNGQLFWEYISITPIYDDFGKIINYLAVKQDISDRKQTEKEIMELNSSLEEKIEKRTAELAETNENLLRQIEERLIAENALAQSEKSYRMVVENVAEVIFQTDAKGLWVFLNKSWETITGFTVNESLGQLFVNYVHPEDRARNWELFEPLIRRQKDYCRHEIRYLTKEGGFRWVEVFAKLGLDENDQVIGTYGTLQDITERKHAEEALSQISARLELVMRVGGIGVWDYDIQNNILFWDDQMLSIYGIAKENFTGTYQDWKNRLHPDDLERCDREIQMAISGQKEFNTQFRIIRPDGSIHHIKGIAALMHDETGRALHLVGSNRDVTSQKRAADFENELLQLAPKLTGISLPEIDGALNLVLQRIGQFLAADRAYIFEFDATSQLMNNTFEWCEDNIEPQINNLQLVPVDMFPEWMNVLRRFDNVIIPSVEDLPENWRPEREILEPQGIRSVIAMPLLVENNLIGFVGLDSVKTRKDYLPSEINILKVWSSIIASIINNKRSEGLLEQTRQNYETFFNTIDDFLFIFEEDGKIVDVNKTVKERLGYHVEDILNRSVLMVRPEDRREEALQVMEDILQGKADFCAIPLVTKSGLQIPVETRISKGFWNGKPAIFGVSKDISQIRLSEQKFASAFHSNSAAMTITRFDNDQFVDVNTAFINLLEYTREEIVGKTLTSLGIVKEIGDGKRIQSFIEEGIPVKDLEINAYSKSNKLFTFLLSAEEIFVGSERCILSIAVDITARKRAEEQLQWNKSLLEMMSNSSPLGFLVVDNRTDEILYFNKRFCQIWGIENLEEQMQRGELKNNDIIPYCIPMLLDIPAFAESCKPLQDENNRIVISDEIPFKNDRTIHRYSTQIRGMDDKYYGRFYIFEDVTEEKKAQHELMNARNEAEQANMAKSEFLSRMSHELRTPMNSILGFAQLLEMGELNPGQKKGVNHILKSGRHLLDLINEVLDISRIEAGRLSLSLEPVLLNAVIPEMIDIIRPQATERMIGIELTDSPSNHLFVKSDQQRLKQVLLNLLNNAIKYNRKNGLVRVSVNLGPENRNGVPMVRISITDTGMGIAESDLSKLFKPFERIGAEKTETEGTGLGLSVVKKLIEVMNGNLGVESTLNQGSTFWIELPLIESQMQNFYKHNPTLPGGTKVVGAGTILYIEDNVSNIDLVEQIISNHRENAQLVTTMHGLQAVKLAIDYQPRLILLDLNLPDIHGSQVLKNLLDEELTRHIPVVVISADAMPQQLERLKKAGARDYLTKPLEVNEFLRIVDQYLDN